MCSVVGTDLQCIAGNEPLESATDGGEATALSNSPGWSGSCASAIRRLQDSRLICTRREQVSWWVLWCHGGANMGKQKRWVVTTSGDRSLSDVRKDLLQSGFTVEQVLGEIGLITGVAEDDVAERVRKVPGVVDVSPEEPIEIGPPDSPVS